MKLKYLVLVLLTIFSINIISANIENPSFEINNSGWIKQTPYLAATLPTYKGASAEADINETQLWASDELQSMCMYNKVQASLGGYSVYARASTTISQNINFYGIDEIQFDMRHYIKSTIPSTLHNPPRALYIKIEVNNTQVYLLSRPPADNCEWDDIYLNQSINVSQFNDIQTLNITNYLSTGTCYNSRLYISDVKIDNFRIINPPAPIIEPNSTITNHSATFDDLFNDLSVWGFLIVIFTAFENECGNDLFWLIIIMIPFTMTWIKQKSVIIPSILALLCGGILFTLIPESAIAPIKILLTIGIAGIFYHIIKSR